MPKRPAPASVEHVAASGRCRAGMRLSARDPSSMLPNGICAGATDLGLVLRCGWAAGGHEGWCIQMAHGVSRGCCVATAALTALLGVPAASFGQASSTTTYSGQAYVVQATVPPLAPIRISDTGPLPSTGGAEETSLLDVPPVSLGSAGGLNGADVAHAAAIAQGSASRSEASVADLSVTLDRKSV